MRVVITSGPSYEPLDDIRRLTNASTGELGTLLSETLADAGHRVTLFRGLGSTYAAPLWPVETVPFTTTADLGQQLLQLPEPETVNAIFHVAALNDFDIASVTNARGESLQAQKISSRIGPVHIRLEPAPKLIGQLRPRFPSSLIIGWKLEMEGSLGQVVHQGQEQMQENLTDACVLNGSATAPVLVFESFWRAGTRPG